MPLVGAWFKVWIYLGIIFGWTTGARPRFDTSTDMGLVLIPADAEVDSVIFRLRATDQDADFPLIFEITATITPVVRIDNLPCTLYNKVCQANVILTKRLIPGRLHDFAVRVRDSKGDSNSMQATISVTNATTQRDKIFPHIPSLIMVPEDTKPGKELDYLLVRANSWSGKPVYIELWQPKELFTIRQRQTPSQTRGVITLIGELDFETQSMYTLTMYATDPYTEPGKDTRNIAGLNVVVVVQDVQDVPPIFTLAPPLTRLNNSVQPGEVILRVHAEDGDKGVPREIAYGLVSEGNPFTPFFNISETTGEIVLARPLEELTQITHVGAPVVLSVVAEEIRRTREEPPAQATVVEVGLLLGEPGNSPPYFESDTYVTVIEENLEPGTIITFSDQYSTRVRDEDIGKAGVFALKLENNNGTFEITPTVAERTADFIITVRDNTFIDYETYKSLIFKIVAQEVGPATNLSASVPVTVYLRDVNDNPPVFEEDSYEVTLSENITAGTRVIQVHATDKDTGDFGRIQYTRIIGQGSEAFTIDSDTGLITVAMGSSLDREMAPKLQLSVEARDENGKGNRGIVPLIVNLLDVNDNVPTFEKSVYVFLLNSDLTNFTAPAVIKATDADAEPPNNVIRYEIIHGNYENKFYLNEITGELILRSPITKVRRKKQSANERLASKPRKELHQEDYRDRIVKANRTMISTTMRSLETTKSPVKSFIRSELLRKIRETIQIRKKRAGDDALYTLTARAYDLGVPHLSSLTQISIISGAAGEDRIVTFVLPEEHPDPIKTAKTLATITGAKVTVQEIRPYVAINDTSNMPTDAKKSVVVARVEKSTAFVDVEKIRETLAANGVGIINASVMMPDSAGKTTSTTNITNTVTSVYNEEVTVYKAENKLLTWLLIILGLLMLLAIAALIICCICPGCPFYMAPRKRRVQSSETLIVRSDGRPKRHLHRKQPTIVHVPNNQERKQAWSADPTRRNWQFNRRNVKNCGLASLPGDVAYVSTHANDTRINVESFGHHRDLQGYDPSDRITGQDRMYVEDIESLKMRDYHMDRDSPIPRHEMDRRGSDHLHQDYRYEHQEADVDDERTVREQHFYREGNAEILRLVTRGQAEDNVIHHHGTTVIVDGKDILLKRFMEDQKMRQDASVQDFEATRSIESIQRVREASHPQPEIILIPQTLNIGQHVDESGPAVQRLLIDRIDFEDTPKEKMPHIPDGQARQESTMLGAVSENIERPTIVNKDHGQSVNVPSYSFHEMELARQNALLTRLLFERETKASGPVIADSTSYLETQSLPGQVAIATQTDRTAATQTERHVRSRSDNDDSEDESRVRKKMKTKKRYESDSKRTRTLWMKSPIEEEGSPCFDKRLSILRKRVKEVKDGRKISIEPEVLREISDSLDDNGSSGKGEEKDTKTYERSTEETSIRYEVLNEEDNGTPSSTEIYKGTHEIFGDKMHHCEREERKTEMDKVESASPELDNKPEKQHIEKQTSSPKKESKKSQKKVEGKPTFRILEREITLLTKKLSKLGEKKTQESTGSDSIHQEKASSTKKSSKKDIDQKTSKTSRTKVSVEPIPSTSKATTESASSSQRKEGSMTKLKQKLKHQHARVMSTGSSELEDTQERSRKESSESNQENIKERHPIHAKVKRQSHVEQRKDKDQESDKQKELSKEHPKSESKFGKLDKSISRSQKAVSTLQKESLSEELSTSTSSDRMESKKEQGPRRGFDKKRSTSSSDNASRQAGQRKSRKIRVQTTEKTLGKTSDVKDSSKGDSERYKTSTDEKSVKKKAISGKIYADEKKKISSVKNESDNIKENDRVVSLKEVLKDFVGFGRSKRGTSEEQAFSDNFEDMSSERVKSPHVTDSTSIVRAVIDNLETKSSKEAIERDSEKEKGKGEAVKESDNGMGQKTDVIEISREDNEKSTKTIADEDQESLKPQMAESLIDKSKEAQEHVEKLQEEIYKSHISNKELEKEIATTSSVSIADKILPGSAITLSTSMDMIREQVPLKDNDETTGSKDEMGIVKEKDEATVKRDIEKFIDTEKDVSSGDSNKLVSKLRDSEKEKKLLDQLVDEDKKVTKDVIEFVDKVSQIALPKQADEVIKETKLESRSLEADKDKDTKRNEEDASKLMAKNASSFTDATKMIETVLELASRRSSPQESDKEKLESSEKTDEKNGKDEVHADALGITSIKVKSNGEGDSIRVSAEVHKDEVTERTESRSTDESKKTAMGLQDKDRIDTPVLEKDTRDVIKEERKLSDAVKASLVTDGFDHLEIKAAEIVTEKDKRVENVEPNVAQMSDESSGNIREMESKKEEPMITPDDKTDIIPVIASSASIEKKEDKSIEEKQDKSIEEKQEKSIEGKQDENIKEKQELETTSIQLSKDTIIPELVKQLETAKDETTDSTSEKDAKTQEKEKSETADLTRIVQPVSELETSLSKIDEPILIGKEEKEVKPIDVPEDVEVEKSLTDPIFVEKPSKPPTPIESHQSNLSSIGEDSKQQTGATETDSKEASEPIETTIIGQEQESKISEVTDMKKDEKKTSEDLILTSSKEKDDERDKDTTVESKKEKQEDRISPESSKGKPSKRDEFEERADETRVQPGEKFAEEIDKGESRREGTEEYKNVSPTIFTSIIDTLDDSDESDSSSDVSRKTTLTTRPYHTPRHRARDVHEKAILPIETTTMESVSDLEDMAVVKIEDEKEQQETVKNLLEAPSIISHKPIKKQDSTTTSKDIEVDERSKDAVPRESLKKKNGTTMSEGIERSEKPKDTTMSKKVTSIAKDRLTSSNIQSQKRQSGSEKTTDTDGSENTKPSKVKTDYKKQTQGKLDESKNKPLESDKSMESDKQVKKLDKEIRGSKRYSERPEATGRSDKKDSSKERSGVKKDPSPDKAPRPSKRRSSKVENQPERKENVKEKMDKETEKTKATSKKMEDNQEKRSKSKKSSGNGEKSSSPPKTSEVELGKTRSKYMAWYTQKREEMEKKREVKKNVEEEDDQDQLPRWLKRSLAHRRSIPEEKKKTPEVTPRTRRKVKPLVNVESEQLKAIVRQGRKLRRAEGGRYEDPPIQIFASTPPAPLPEPQKTHRHHLFQHSEYKYEKIPPPFYLHPPPAPHPSPQLSPEHFDPLRSMEYVQSQEDLDSGITVSMPTGTKLRHQQLLEKKSVFDIAYSEAVPPHLRADSTTPPS